MIPNELNITLDSAVEKNAELKRAIATEPRNETAVRVRENSRRSVAQRRRARGRRGHRRSRFVRLHPALSRRERQRRDQPVSDGAAERSRPAEDGFPRTENADRDRGHADSDSQTRAGFFAEEHSAR